MLFTLIFGGFFVLAWSFCGLVPWLVNSILTRGNAGLSVLPLCLFAAVVAATTVPLVGFDGRGGFYASFLVAMAASAALLVLRRFAFGATSVEPGPPPSDVEPAGNAEHPAH